MLRIRILPTIILAAILIVSQARADMLIERDLSAQLAIAAPDQFLPVVFILKPQVEFDAIYPAVKDLPEAARRSAVITALQKLAENSQPFLLEDLQILKREVRVGRIRPLWISNVIGAEIAAGELTSIVSRHPEIARVHWDPKRDLSEVRDDFADGSPGGDLDLLSWGVEDIRAHLVWDLGITGQDVVIANLDFGVDYNHPDLENHIWVNPGEDLNQNGIVDSSDWNGQDDDYNGYVDDLRGWDFFFNVSEVMDTDGHGTNTAGIVLGDGTSGNATGVAPGARMMVLKNMGGEIDYWEAQQYAILMGADIITCSVSFKWRQWGRPDYATMRQNTEMELAAGLIHTNSIGNEGDNLNTDPIPFNIATPGNCPPPWLHPDQTLIGGLSSVLGVGAYDVNHILKAYSSIGPAAWNLADILFLDPTWAGAATWPPEYNDYPYRQGDSLGLLKPDIAAPTEVITTAIGGGYATLTGTSAATPHLGGALCLLLSADPTATPEILAQLVMTTAIDEGQSGKDNYWGCGRLDAFAAISALLMQSNGALAGTVTDANTGLSIEEAFVELPSLNIKTRTDQFGDYFFPGIPAGIHDFRFTAQSYDTLWVTGLSFSVGVVQSLSVELTGPQIQVGISSIEEQAAWGTIVEVPILVQNPGSSSLNVEFLKRGDWLPYEIYGGINAQIAANDDELFGVEIADGSVWISGGNSGLEPNKLYRFSYDGDLLETLDQPLSPSSQGWHDLAWDGQYLYGSSDSEILGIDLTGTIQEVISGPLGLHRALTYDPDSDHFFSCDSTSNIVEFGRDGVILRSLGHNLHISGLAWHEQDADSAALYIFSQDGSPALLRVSKMNPDEGEIIYVTDLIAAAGEKAGGATIAGDIDPDRWCFVGMIQGLSDRVQYVSLDAYAPWLNVFPQTGTIPSGESLQAVANLDAGQVPPGEYDIQLVIQHNAPQDEIVIPVAFLVSAAGVEASGTPETLPQAFKLGRCYPNPFNSETIIPFELPEKSQVRIDLFNVQGRLVTKIFEGEVNTGWLKFRYNAKYLASGVYFYRITAEGKNGGSFYKAVGKMLLMK